MILKSLIYLYANKNSKHLFYKFNDWIESLAGEKQIIQQTAKIKDSVGMKKTEERDRQFLCEKIIHSIKFHNSYENSIGKKTEIIDTVENNYKISRRLPLFVDISDSFIEYIYPLIPDEIQELDADIKINRWGIKSLLEVENAYELLSVFEMFYRLNGRFPLTNGLLIVPYGEVPEGDNKIILNQLYEMFKDTNSHGLVYPQFLCALGIFFGADKSTSKTAITELYKNLSYERLSSARDLDFQGDSNVISEVRFQIKPSTLLNIKRKDQLQGLMEYPTRSTKSAKK